MKSINNHEYFMTLRPGHIFILLLLVITSCTTENDEGSVPSPKGTTTIPPTSNPEVSDLPQITIIEEESSQPPDPIQLNITTEDGADLEAVFYPAASQSAPIVVLMHWYPGDQNEWKEIAYWLQNRGHGGESNGVPWKDPSWFPMLGQDQSYNVLTFSFRGCKGRCDQFLPDLWLMDSEAALKHARTLPGVDPNRVIAIGASIGADGAIDGCAAVLEKDSNACLGALSLSPGNYLNISYEEMVNTLAEREPPRPAWCLFDQNDPDSTFCSQIKGENYYMEGWSDGNLHGMHLITPNLDPKPLVRLLEFLALVLD